MKAQGLETQEAPTSYLTTCPPGHNCPSVTINITEIDECDEQQERLVKFEATVESTTAGVFEWSYGDGQSSTSAFIPPADPSTGTVIIEGEHTYQADDSDPTTFTLTLHTLFLPDLTCEESTTIVIEPCEPMFGLELIAGRDFSRDYGTDAGVRDENGYFVEVTAILNEEAVRQFGWSSPEEAIGKQIIRDPNAGDWTANVIGVTKDFHFANLRQPIGPGVLILLPSYSYLSVRMHPGEIKPILADLEEKMGIFAPETAFGYNFLEASFRAQYEEEQRLGEVFSYISSLAILIAC